MQVWTRIENREAGFAFSLSEAMSILAWRFPDFLQSVRHGTLVITSDYSGQHRQASHEAYSFLITTDSELRNWMSEQAQFRSKWLPDGRRMSFKRLQDGVRSRALIPFLETAFGLRGNLVTIMVDKRVGPFIGGNTCELTESFPDCFPATTPSGTVDKMVTLSSLLAMLVAGFRREDQTAYWVSDDDETLDTNDKREGLARLTSYLTFGFAHWRESADLLFVTTGAPEAPAWAEDLAAIPDLMAGSFCVLSSVLPRFFGHKEVAVQHFNSASADDLRARRILNWVSQEQRPLRSVLLRLEIDENGAVRSSYQVITQHTPLGT